MQVSFHGVRRDGAAHIRSSRSTSFAAAATGLAALLAAIAAAPACAQAGSELPEVVVTAARQPQPLADALPSTTVITRHDIDRWQQADLLAALGREAGVQLAQAGGRGTTASLFLRGAAASQVLVLVDGVRLNAGTSGAAVLGGISLDAIDRVEIVRGNLSSLYGSSAIGGVVQIFTRRGAEPGFTASVEAGDGRTVAGHVAGGADAGAVRVGGALGGGTTEAISAIAAERVIPGPFAPGANPEPDGNQYLSASLGARWQPDQRTLLSANAWLSRNRTDFDSTADGPTATHRETSQLASGQLLGRVAVAEDWATQLALGASRDRSTNRASDPFSFNNNEFESDNVSAAWTNDLRLTTGLNAHAGAEYLYQAGESTSYDPAFSGVAQRFTRSAGSGWAGVTGDWGAHLVQLNVRYDRYSDAGGATSGLASYGYRITPQWRVSAQVSNAFRAPSFNDLYFPGFGNPDLDPERSTSGELGLQYLGGPLTLRATLYRTDTRDLIVYDAVTQQAQNLDDARMTGGELIAAWAQGPWRVALNGALLRAVDRNTGQRLLRRARWTATLAAGFDPGPWSAGFEVSAVGPRDDSDINTFQPVELSSYTVARVLAAWRVTDSINLRARVENLFDEEYELVHGYNVLPRTVIVGVDLKF